MVRLDPGYSRALFDRSMLLSRAQQALRALQRAELESGKSLSVAVTGKSGIAMAFVMLSLSPINIVAVRKENETSHGSKLEGAHTLTDYVILDDFVDTGDTIRTVIGSIATYAEISGAKGSSAPRCLGFIEYMRPDGTRGRDLVTRSDGRVVWNCGNERYLESWKQWLNRL